MYGYIWQCLALCAILTKLEKVKNGEVTVSVFPPPREHGKAHCHVRAKKSRKVKGKSKEVYPEIKVYLDGSEPDIITEGFSERDMEVIGDVIFNEPEEGQIPNDEYLEIKWEELHNGES